MAREADPRIKAQALADLERGETISATARRYAISRAAIQRWRDQEQVAIPAAVQEKRLELGRRVAVFMDEGFETLITHARLARDPAWFAQQSAESLAVYDGVLFDKMAFIIGNLRDGAEEAAGLDDTGGD